MCHFIVKTTSTSTKKEADDESEIIKTDAERGLIDFSLNILFQIMKSHHGGMQR
jgi:hypothetical protein